MRRLTDLALSGRARRRALPKLLSFDARGYHGSIGPERGPVRCSALLGGGHLGSPEGLYKTNEEQAGGDQSPEDRGEVGPSSRKCNHVR